VQSTTTTVLPNAGPVSAHFDGDCQTAVIAALRRCTAVVGCVAWLRCPEILAALENVQCTLAITNDVKLPVDKYKKLTPFLEGLPAVSKVGLARGRHRELMHHKFLVGFTPQASFVLTGSFNYTQHSSKHNLENVVCIENKTLAQAYLREAKAVLEVARPVTRKRAR